MGMMINRRRGYGGSNRFIKFADPVVKSVCVEKWGGADGGTAANRTRKDGIKVQGYAGEITYEQAASIISTDQELKNNYDVTSFDEFQYFIGLTTMSQIVTGAKNLVSIILPDSLTIIGDYSFFWCTSIQSIVITCNVTNIKFNAFNSATNLQSLTLLPTNPPSLGSGALNGTHANLQIYVPAESVDAYKAADGWSNYASKIVAIPTT